MDAAGNVIGTLPATCASAPVLAHLRRLGVTAVELLPIHHFVDDRHLLERGLRNYWGYNSIGFFAPDPRYSASGDAVNEFKAMVKALHAAGIEVILDVVYNHTGEGNHLGPTHRQRRARRFARLPAPLPARPPENRPRLPGRHRVRSGCGRAAHLDCPARTFARPAIGGRGCRESCPGRVPAHPGVRAGAGLSFLPAGIGRRGGRVWLFAPVFPAAGLIRLDHGLPWPTISSLSTWSSS